MVNQYRELHSHSWLCLSTKKVGRPFLAVYRFSVMHQVGATGSNPLSHIK